MDKVDHGTPTIREVLEEIKLRKIILPSIQRKFVWDQKKIVKLFDSLMLNYPIGAFLLWEIDRDDMDDYVFYEFIKDVKRNFNWNHIIVKAQQDNLKFSALLDGQQRMTALYSGLHGTYQYLPWKKWSKNPDNYIEKILHLNILYDKDNQSNKVNNLEYGFEFITDKDAKKIDSNNLWFRIGSHNRFLQCKDHKQINTFINQYFAELVDEHNNGQVKNIIKKNQGKINDQIRLLYDKVLEAEITTTTVVTPSIDKVLEIFIRVNSGGIKLSKADLLFSTITAKWPEGRDEIEDLIKKCKGLGYIFDTDLIMRTCLVLTDLEVLFNVEKGFTKNNVDKIRNSWPQIKSALETTTEFLQTYSFTDNYLKSKNSIIPIAYFISKKRGKPTDNDKEEFFNYLVRVHLKNTYGSHGDTVLGNIRKILKNENKDTLKQSNFTLKQLIDDPYFNKGEKSLTLTEDDLDDWFKTRKSANTFFILSLLYPPDTGSHVIEQDHIHPATGFQKNKLKRLGFPKEEIDVLMIKKDFLPNLELMDFYENTKKQNKAFGLWINERYPSRKEQRDFMDKNYIPKNSSLDFNYKDFLQFFEAREKLLRSALEKKYDFKKISE